MKHLVLLIAMALTCVLAAVANVVVSRIIDLNVFTLKILIFIPAGAVIVGMLGASGAFLAARYCNIHPNAFDALMMILVAAGTMILIYYLDYATFVLDDGRRVSDLIDFSSYVDLSLTKAHMRVGRGQHDTGEVGQMGYLLALLEFLGFLAGGASTFFLIKDQWRCESCGAYLRRLKTKQSKILTADEVANLHEHFKQGDLDTVQAVMAWKPPERKIPSKERQAMLAFDLFHCPQCRSETISTKVSVFTGREWKDVPELTVRRNFSEGLSLRDQFR